ncbi:MAG TPA: hypothetical protein VHZ55_19850 [Bryobacteraceae bacterium]|nr:hypothetical protein [Bryobacteraceae bacterium]
MQTPEPAPALDSQYDLDAMMEALVQGRGEWVHENTRPAAEAGAAKAQLMMGILFQIGAGVERDGREAVKFYRLAALQGDVLAWRNLGTLYLLGLAGVEVDKTEAHHCFMRANMTEMQSKAKELLSRDGTIQ